MDPIAALSYKLAILVLVSIVMGFILFMKGFKGAAAEEIKFGIWASQGIAPGMGFALLGAVIAYAMIRERLTISGDDITMAVAPGEPHVVASDEAPVPWHPPKPSTPQKAT